MAGDSSAATEPTPGESSREQEKSQSQARSETGQPRTENGVQQESDDNRPLPPLPPRPLPAPHHETRKSQRPLPPPHGVHFGPLPIEEPNESTDFQRPYYPRWLKGKLGLMTLSLMVCAIIFGVGIALGFHNAPYYEPGYDLPVDYEFGISGAAAGLAVVITTVEVLTTCLSRRREGMHPGALVAAHLIIWLLALIAIIVTTIFGTNSYDSGYYEYPSADRAQLHSQSQIYEQVLLGFDCVLLAIHFILFVGACVETNHLETAKKKVIVVRVPVQAGAPYPGGQYPVYGSPQTLAPQPGGQPGQFPVTMMSQVPSQAGERTGPVPPQAAALYGGYYAPAPPGMTWTTSQQGNPGLMQGYYAPAPAPAGTPSNSKRQSRRSQRQAQALPQSTDQPTEQQAAQHEQVRPEEPVVEKNP